MNSQNPVAELLADLDRRIDEEEAKVRQTIDRLSEYDDPYIEDQIRREWNQFHLRVQPMREQREYIIKQQAYIVAAQPIGPVIIQQTRNET